METKLWMVFLDHCDLLVSTIQSSLSLNKCCRDPDRSHLGHNWKQSYHKGGHIDFIQSSFCHLSFSYKHIWAVAYRDLLMTLMGKMQCLWVSLKAKRIMEQTLGIKNSYGCTPSLHDFDENECWNHEILCLSN